MEEQSNITAKSVLLGSSWIAITALFLLRFCLGLHFFSEGTKKISYNEARDEWELVFSAEPFLSQATGPLAGFYRSQVPGFHQWEELLAVPRQAKEPTEEDLAAEQTWQEEYERRRREAIEAGEVPPFEFPEYAPYANWAEQIKTDFRLKFEGFTDIASLTDEQRARAVEIFQERLNQLSKLFEEEAVAISEFQHELWRLQRMQNEQSSREVPYAEERLRAKEAETSSYANSLVNRVRGIERGLSNDLLKLIGEDAQGNQAAFTEATEALESSRERWLRVMNWTITWVVTGVGVCLLLGLFTRVASVVGIVFLLSVMNTQLPWVEGAQTDYFFYQLAECASFFVLVVSTTWKLPGLDYIIRGLFFRNSSK